MSDDDRSTIKVILNTALEELVFGVEVRPIAARVMVKLKKYGYFSQRNHDPYMRRYLQWNPSVRAKCPDCDSDVIWLSNSDHDKDLLIEYWEWENRQPPTIETIVQLIDRFLKERTKNGSGTDD